MKIDLLSEHRAESRRAFWLQRLVRNLMFRTKAWRTDPALHVWLFGRTRALGWVPCSEDGEDDEPRRAEARRSSKSGERFRADFLRSLRLSYLGSPFLFWFNNFHGCYENHFSAKQPSKRKTRNLKKRRPIFNSLMLAQKLKDGFLYFKFGGLMNNLSSERANKKI